MSPLDGEDLFLAQYRANLQCWLMARNQAVSDADSEVRRLSRALVEAERRAYWERQLALAAAHQLDSGDGPIREEYRLLHSLPDVAAVDVGEQSVQIRTRPLEVRHEGRRYRVGVLLIRLGWDGAIEVRSLQPPREHPLWDHPHVQNGLPCLGTLRPGLVKLIALHQVGAAAQILLEFLSTCDPETAYCKLDLWEEVADDGG